MPVLYGPEEAKRVCQKNILKQTQFLSGKHKAGLERIFLTKGTKKGIYIPIGVHILRLDSIIKRNTKNGMPMYVLSFKKHGDRITVSGVQHPFGWPSPFNNNIYPYLPILCYHIIQVKNSLNFATRFYEKYTNNLAERDLLKLKKGLLFKGIIKHVEEPWTLNDGTIQVYEGGAHRGEQIVLHKPEIYKLYHIDTPNEDIQINYFTLYKPYKR